MNERIIPINSEEVTKEGISAIVYVGPGFKAKGFKGKSIKKSFYYKFSTQADMNNYIDKFFQNVEAEQKVKQERKSEKNNFKTSLVVGDILYSSWGYEQTNIDFYQVVEVSNTKKTVKIREIESKIHSTGDMSGTKMPDIGNFIGEIKTKKVQPNNYVGLNSYSSASKWDGFPKSFSSYA